MSDQLLPDFDGPGSEPPEQPSPRKPKPRPTRRPAKKVAKRAAPAPKPAKRVPKKRRVRKMPAPTAEFSVFSDKSYQLIRELLTLNSRERKLIVAMVQGLTFP